MDQLKESCFSETAKLNAASLNYQRRVELTKSESRTFTVTLRSEPLDLPGHVDEEVLVACTVSARLVASSEDLGVSPTDWVEQQYLPPDDTGWKWVLTGKSAGESDAVLELKPAIRLANSDGSTRVEDLRTEQFTVTFDTHTTLRQKLTSFWGLLIAFATGLAALIGAWYMLRKLLTGKGDDAAT